ncbi:uncharacterized protein Dere_GG26510 [Drosophila erecta]|uniref:Uncharacterized protein n=1 Tax=Drosophila erecta TaxID=7220 RepID=A0A0Q5WKS1_DROER|nr:uncharacterized protein Dere_GG26510 [Drosophila erecta]
MADRSPHNTGWPPSDDQKREKKGQEVPTICCRPIRWAIHSIPGIQIPFIWNTIRLELTSVEWRKGKSRKNTFTVPLFFGSTRISAQDNGNADAAKNELEDPCDSTSVSRSALLFSRTW